MTLVTISGEHMFLVKMAELPDSSKHGLAIEYDYATSSHEYKGSPYLS